MGTYFVIAKNWRKINSFFRLLHIYKCYKASIKLRENYSVVLKWISLYMYMQVKLLVGYMCKTQMYVQFHKGVQIHKHVHSGCDVKFCLGNCKIPYILLSHGHSHKNVWFYRKNMSNFTKYQTMLFMYCLVNFLEFRERRHFTVWPVKCITNIHLVYASPVVASITNCYLCCSMTKT